MAAPATQVFLFLSQEQRQQLFRQDSNNYYFSIQSVKSKLPGFFTYDFIPIELLIKAFLAARDRDFIEAIETGEYGNNYKALKNDISKMLVNKKVNIDKDISGVTFSLDKNGENIELYPEDLSHGELKRLSIYIWLKYGKIENAIVLIDELEIALHPDWQYQIISDLIEWSPTNQYILATHSYELCQAVTPAHVKEIEPKLIKKEA
jgi:AAA15 family ATPase/GTPase